MGHRTSSEQPALIGLRSLGRKVVRKSSPCPVMTGAAEAKPRMDYAVTGAGSVTVPGVASAASVAVSKYVWGSTPPSFADSHSV